MGILQSRPKNVLSFQGSNNTDIWALVTGATSGIGYDIARELCQRGLNVILHGRDVARLEKVSRTLRSEYNVQVQTLLLDASTAFQATGEFSKDSLKLITDLSSLKIKVLVNNVGTGHNPVSDFVSFTDQSISQISRLLNVNISFMTYLTHALLPVLQKNASADDPSIIINIGSLAEMGLPWVTVYSAAKAYVTAFSKALDTELKGEKQNIKVVASVIGDTDSDGHKVGTSMFTPRSENMARMIIDSACTGSGVVRVPFWPHWLQQWLCLLQPHWLLQLGFIYNISDLRRKMMKQS